MGTGRYLNRCLPALGTFLVLGAHFASADLSGKAETLPETGFIRVQGKVLSLQGIQVIAHDAICADKTGHWSCGETAWQVFEKKLAAEPVRCILMIELARREGVPERAKCLLKNDSLSAWLVRQGWALTGRDPDALFSSEESYARKKRVGVWRDGFIPPDVWRTDALNDSESCDVCTARHQSILRTRDRRNTHRKSQLPSE